MDIKSVVSEVSDQADEFLADVTRRDEARAGIAEWLTIHYSMMAPADKKAVIEQTMHLLGNEGFFDRAPGIGD